MMTTTTSQRTVLTAAQWTLLFVMAPCPMAACTAAPAWAPSTIPRLSSHPHPCPPTLASQAVSSCAQTTYLATATAPSLLRPIDPHQSMMLSCGRSGACSQLTMTCTANRCVVWTSVMPVLTASLRLWYIASQRWGRGPLIMVMGPVQDLMPHRYKWMLWIHFTTSVCVLLITAFHTVSLWPCRSATVSQSPMARIREDQPAARGPVIHPALMEVEAAVAVEV